MKHQEYLIEVGDEVLYRSNCPISEGYGFVHDKDYLATVTHHHPEGSTSVQFIGDDGQMKTSSVEYNDFNCGMSTCQLILAPEEVKRRQDAYICKLLTKAETEYQEKVERIQALFD